MANRLKKLKPMLESLVSDLGEKLLEVINNTMKNTELLEQARKDAEALHESLSSVNLSVHRCKDLVIQWSNLQGRGAVRALKRMVKAKGFKERFEDENQELTVNLQDLQVCMNSRSYLKLDQVLAAVVSKEQICKDGDVSQQLMKDAIKRDERDYADDVKSLMLQDAEFKAVLIEEFADMKTSMQQNFTEMFTMITQECKELSSHVSVEAEKTRDFVSGCVEKDGDKTRAIGLENQTLVLENRTLVLENRKLLLQLLEHKERQGDSKSGGVNKSEVPARVGEVHRKDSDSLLLNQNEVKQAVVQVQEEAEQGDMNALYTLAMCHSQGQGVKLDLVKAFQLFQKAANMGHAKAIRRVGVAYYYGQGVARDEKRAFTLFEQAAHEGDPRARLNMSLMVRDPRLAREYEKSIPSMEELTACCPKNDDHGLLVLKLRKHWRCDECHREYRKQESKYCQPCDFDMCYSCCLSMQPLMREIACVCPSGHGGLLCKVPYQKSGGRWSCDQCGVTFNNNGDLSQNCSTCQYDLCYVCALSLLQQGRAKLIELGQQRNGPPPPQQQRSVSAQRRWY